MILINRLYTWLDLLYLYPWIMIPKHDKLIVFQLSIYFSILNTIWLLLGQKGGWKSGGGGRKEGDSH